MQEDRKKMPVNFTNTIKKPENIYQERCAELKNKIQLKNNK
jgi:hypothetical protein